MRVFVTVVFLPLACATLNASDDTATLAMLKSAYAQHAASWSDGKMQFKTKADYTGSLCVDVEGELEWSKDHVYFRGTQIDSRGPVPGSEPVHLSIQILRAHGEVAALVHGTQEGRGPWHMAYLFPDDGSRHDNGLMSLMPDPLQFLVSLSPLNNREFTVSVRPDENAENDKLIRTIEVNEHSVVIHNNYFKGGSEYQMNFRLDSGGLCDAMKIARPVKGGMQIQKETRQWRQSVDARWFPEKTVVEVHSDSKSPNPPFRYTLTISECLPLERPSISITPSLTLFGPLLDGYTVCTRGANGKLVLDDVSAARPPEFEEQLRQQADKIRGIGFSAGSAK